MAWAVVTCNLISLPMFKAAESVLLKEIYYISNPNNKKICFYEKTPLFGTQNWVESHRFCHNCGHICRTPSSVGVLACSLCQPCQHYKKPIFLKAATYHVPKATTLPALTHYWGLFSTQHSFLDLMWFAQKKDPETFFYILRLRACYFYSYILGPKLRNLEWCRDSRLFSELFWKPC